ncbi:hypothetical protein [Streptomyces noursei]|uniref:Uncharacterized protein n=1 Tax=Streptomyces noursei TaxID=1971 RepID=A0A2N8PR48_STRNR|nr:hypothetical protein [Streptomyces noursei]PNE43483.1 hypothetical protein AOB60_00765 [Streptomyces noursei]
MTTTTVALGAIEPLVPLLLRQLLAVLWPRETYAGPTATLHTDEPLRIPAHLAVAEPAAAAEGARNDHE